MLRSSNIGTLTSHWWGTRVLHSKAEGYNFSYHLTSNANAIDAVALILGHLILGSSDWIFNNAIS